MVSTGTLMAYGTGFVVAASMIEAWVLTRKPNANFDWNEVMLSFVDLIGRKLLAFLPVTLATPIFNFAWDHRLQTLSMHSVLAVLLLFIGQEFCYYWYHRASHRIRFFWATHAVHHSPNQLTLSTAFRLGWTEKLAGPAMFFAPLVWLGVRPELVVTTLMINLLYQFWLHNTWMPKLGWFEYVFNTPSAHRVHHASNAEYLDANFGGVLIVFDRLFGTYVEEREDVPCRYGLTTPTRTRNPLVVEFEHWVSLARDIVKSKNPLTAISYVLQPPGWNPEGVGQTAEELRKQAKAKVEVKVHA